MTLPLERIEAEALALSAEEDDPAEVERAWEEEIRRSLAATDAGKMEMIPADHVFAELRVRLRRRQ